MNRPHPSFELSDRRPTYDELAPTNPSVAGYDALVSHKAQSTPAPKIQYAVDRLPAGRLVRSNGLEAIGQREIAAFVADPEPHDTDHQVMDVLQFIANYLIKSGARIVGGQTMAYGWTMLRFGDARPQVLEIEEDTEPFSPEHPVHWGPGLRRAIELRLAGDAVMRRNRLTGQAEHPNRGHFALACDHLTDTYSGMIVAQRHQIVRSSSPTPWVSGWELHCGATEHADGQWHRHHLTHLIHPRPFVMPYLCMPEGAMVAFDAEGAIVWKPGSDSGTRDPEDPRSWKLR